MPVDKKYPHIVRKSISMHINEYEKIMKISKNENRSFSNVILTAVKRYEEKNKKPS